MRKNSVPSGCVHWSPQGQLRPFNPVITGLSSSFCFFVESLLPGLLFFLGQFSLLLKLIFPIYGMAQVRRGNLCRTWLGIFLSEIGFVFDRQCPLPKNRKSRFTLILKFCKPTRNFRLIDKNGLRLNKDTDRQSNN